MVTVELPPCDIFINATYPKPWKTHLTTFLQYSEDMADIMAQNGGGSIINFASIYGMIGSDYRIYEGTDMDCEIE
ncbi:MAG: hypothetical protein KKB76_07285, partial [Candidatus Omnitrophica bacterium]|nr:hypothetical protein [Candidatus Omnitrophota bacterium]